MKTAKSEPAQKELVQHSETWHSTLLTRLFIYKTRFKLDSPESFTKPTAGSFLSDLRFKLVPISSLYLVFSPSEYSHLKADIVHVILWLFYSWPIVPTEFFFVISFSFPYFSIFEMNWPLSLARVPLWIRKQRC